MTRVSVPADYEYGSVQVCGVDDYHYPEAQVQVDDRHARDVTVREDEDGRYVEVNANHADAVREFLHDANTTAENAETGASGASGEDTPDGSDDEAAHDDADADADESGTCTETVERTGEECGRDLPCQYHSDDGEG